MRYLKFSVFVVLFAAGCSALPGLRVLTGDDDGGNNLIADTDNLIEDVNLVMADKTDSTNPSLIAAADRIEAAARSDVDIIEIRRDDALDAFEVNLLWQPAANASAQEANDSIRRAVELTWQGTLPESEGADVLRINILQTQSISTLDHGPSTIGFVVFNVEIARSDAIAYLSDSRSINDFFGLIAEGTMEFGQPDTFETYDGAPNHPMFMLPDLGGDGA